MAYAIDFGTSNTVITRINPVTEQPETVSLSGVSVQLANNPPLIPSLVYVENAQKGQVIIGQKVRDRGLDLKNNPRFFSTFKRGIGAKIQGFLPELDDTDVTFEQVGEWFLNQLIDKLSNDINKLDSLVLTVPVDSFESYRNWLSQVGQNWSVEQLRIIDEPTAAALGYQSAGCDLVLVIDFGGGTIDLSLVQLSNKQSSPQGFLLKWGEKMLGKNKQDNKIARVLAKAGQNLGGSDLDNWLIDYFNKTKGIPKSSLTTRLAERLKIKLSSQEKATEVYFNDETFETYQLELDRTGFEAILEEQEFFKQLDDLMSQVLQQARRNGIEKTDIDAVLLVGGSVQIPAVKKWVGEYFETEKIKSDRPFEAIALGALQLAQGIEVKDFLYHSYGVRYWNRKKNCHSWQPIIKQGQSYPMNSPVELTLGASLENQPSIELIIGELGTETSSYEVYFEGNRLVTRTAEDKETTAVQPLNDTEGAKTIAKLNPLGNPGSDRLRVQFLVDSQRFLRITVEDLLTDETLVNNQVVVRLA